jgi:N-acetylmuramic acid 6-phosphate (MurNAc-6-P) etherase
MSQQETNEIVKQDLIQMIRRQTDYDEETCIQKLKEYNGNVELVVRAFHGLDQEKKSSTTLSTNQQIFKTIREKF